VEKVVCHFFNVTLFEGFEKLKIPKNPCKKNRIRYNKGMAKQVKLVKKPSKIRQLWLNIGKLILDATKLCFGSLVLGAAIRGEIPQNIMMLIGSIISVGGGAIGISLVTLFEEK